MSEANTPSPGSRIVGGRPHVPQHVDLVKWLRALTEIVLVEVGREGADVDQYADAVELLQRFMRKS